MSMSGICASHCAHICNVPGLAYASHRLGWSMFGARPKATPHRQGVSHEFPAHIRTTERTCGPPVVLVAHIKLHLLASDEVYRGLGHKLPCRKHTQVASVRGSCSPLVVAHVPGPKLWFHGLVAPASLRVTGHHRQGTTLSHGSRFVPQRCCGLKGKLRDLGSVRGETDKFETWAPKAKKIQRPVWRALPQSLRGHIMACWCCIR